MNRQNQPLRCEVTEDRLVISIGIETIAWACKIRNGGPVPNSIKVLDMEAWAKDVARALAHEDEIGNTPLSETLDNAMQHAMERGSVGLSY